MSNYDPQLALRQTIAGVLDHPSVYMGGPSRQHLRKADQIIECLRRDPRLIEALRAGMETAVEQPNDAFRWICVNCTTVNSNLVTTCDSCSRERYPRLNRSPEHE